LDGYAFSGADELARQIELLRQTSPTVRVGGILLTRQYKSGVAMDRERELRRDGRFWVYSTVISNSPKVPESSFSHCPVAVFAPHSWATISYKRFAQEFLAREEAVLHG